MGRCKREAHCGNPAWCKITGKCLKAEGQLWARKDHLQHVRTRGGLMCAIYPDTEGRADLEPIYTQADMDAALAAERERWASTAKLLETALEDLGQATSFASKKSRDRQANTLAALQRALRVA